MEVDRIQGTTELDDACIAIREQTDSAQLRRTALALAAGLSFDETLSGKVALVVTEAAKNLLKHAGGGQVILRPLESGGVAGIEVLALDKGPGIANVTRSFEDGYSTAGTAGTGLGAIARLSHEIDIYTRPGQGTVLMAQIWNRNGGGTRPAAAPRFRVGGVCIPLPGETQSGDGWLFQEDIRGGRITMADGLGHGADAAVASRAAVRTAREQTQASAPDLLERIHGALRPTRGAAVAVAELDGQAQVVRFAGVGNIGAAVVPLSGPVRRLVSYAGTAGHQARKIQEFTYPWDARSLLVMHSDGLISHWSFDAYPGLILRHPSVIAGVLYRDYVRGKDDVTVVVAQEVRPEL
jgi:anti-sigma regulatory factor (Ser/Thr protein kinase)